MAPWLPGMPWPSGMPGGAAAPAWGGYIRFWIRAGLAPGRTWTMGPHTNDRLDSGNVMGGTSVPALLELEAERAEVFAVGSRLWVDLTCDALDVTIEGGASSSAGIFSKADASTITVTLADPDGIYDPLNPVPPWTFAGQSRLVPGTPIEAFVEVVDGDTGTWERCFIFTGTADSWGEDWTPHPTARRAKLIASDVIKQWANLDRPEQAPAGDGDTTKQRVQRLVTFYAWPGIIDAPAGSGVATLQATTLAQSGWELLNRTMDDELGSVYFTPEGHLRWTDRSVWSARTTPVFTIGCDTVPGGAGAFDIITDAEPSMIDEQLRNRVDAARTGGVTQTASSTSSIGRYGEYDYKRTDLGLRDDAQAGAWANAVVQLNAFPQQALANVVLRPDVHTPSWEAWLAVLEVVFITDLVRVVWAPPDRPSAVVDIPSRVVGFKHRISRHAWELEWELIAAGNVAKAATVFHIGPHPQDRLSAGFVMG